MALFSICAIGRFSSSLQGIEKAFAENIELTPETIKNHSTVDGTVRWLELPKTSGDTYRISRWQMWEHGIDHLGIRNNDVFLEFNGTGTAQPASSRLNIDHLHIQAGTLSVITTSNTSLNIHHFDQAGGQVIIKAAGENAIGLNFHLPALPEKEAQYEQHGGAISIYAEAKGKGIILDNDWYKKDGGTLNISAINGGHGITTKNTENNNTMFEQTGGTTRIHASGTGSTGIQTQTFLVSDGNLFLSAENGGRALDLGERGNFILDRGRLILHSGANAKSGWAIYGNAATFGSKSIIQPVLDLAVPEYMNNAMHFSNVMIHAGATIKFAFTNTATIASAEKIDIKFMEIHDPEGKITGEFWLENESGTDVQAYSGSKLLYDYEMKKVNDNRSYIVSLIPKQKPSNDLEAPPSGVNRPSNNLQPSDYLNKANRSAARALEKGLSFKTPGNREHDTLSRAYDRLHNSDNLSELQRNARGLHAYQATRFSSLIADSHDRFSHSFQRELVRTAPQPTSNKGKTPYLQPNPTLSWLKPLGGYSHYNADSSSYRGLGVNYAGVTTGIARHYHNMTAGAAFGFIQSHLTAPENYSADSKTLLFTAGLSTGAFNISPFFKPLFDATAAYGRTNLKQNRTDILSGYNKSEIQANSLYLSTGIRQEYSLRGNSGLRLIPKATVEYTHVWQSGYRERGGNLPLHVASARFHSLRPKIGEELFLPINRYLTLNAYGYYRYELLDTHTDLKTGFIAIPQLNYMTIGEAFGRNSANAGFEMTYQLREAISISGSYDLLIANSRRAHQFYLQSNIRF